MLNARRDTHIYIKVLHGFVLLLDILVLPGASDQRPRVRLLGASVFVYACFKQLQKCLAPAAVGVSE